MCMDEFNPRDHPAGGGGAPADNRTEHFKVSTQFPFQSFNMTHFLGEIRPIFKHTCFCCSLEAMNYGDCGVWDRAQVTVLHCTPLYHMVSLVTFKKVLQVHLPRSRMLSRKARCIWILLHDIPFYTTGSSNSTPRALTGTFHCSYHAAHLRSPRTIPLPSREGLLQQC